MNESLEKLKMIVPWYFGSIENPANHPEFDEKFAQINGRFFFCDAKYFNDSNTSQNSQ